MKTRTTYSNFQIQIFIVFIADSSSNLIYGDNCHYDSNGRLVKILDSGSSTTTRATYGYDQQGQLTSAMVGGTNYEYSYDTAGNIQSKKVGGTKTNYTYGNSAWRDLLTAYNGGSITYSGGNPTKYYDGSTFTWTQGRRLATAKVDGTNISYTYDMAGVRSSKTVGSTKYDFTTLSGLVTRQTGGGKTIDFVYDENNQPLAMKYNNTLYYYVLNAQGDVVRIVNSSCGTVASYTYDPWGKIISSSGTLADINPLRYRGYYYDAETGFYYLQSRYYDPEIGRFINADSYASTDAAGLLSTNMFAYCENDPVNRSDPSGEVYLEVLLTGAAIGIFKQFATDVISNAIAGRPLDQLSSVGTYAAAAVSGMTEIMPGGGLMAAAVDILFSPIIQETIDVAVYGDRVKYSDVASGIAKNGASKGISVFANEKADKIESAAKKQYGAKKRIRQFAAKAVRVIGKHASNLISFIKAAIK